jgi:hypothetical protein
MNVGANHETEILGIFDASKAGMALERLPILKVSVDNSHARVGAK